MKLLIINSVCGIRSTGRICTDIAKEYEQKGYEVKIAYGREIVPEEFKRFATRIGNKHLVWLNALLCRLLDNDGFAAKSATKKFIKWAEEYNPDELWIHNLHGYYINIELLFAWIKSRPKMKVKWTLHDCWSFTGHCPYFTYAKCEKWKTQCANCPQKERYPKSNFCDNSKSNFLRKRMLFNGVNDMLLITPSKWLANLVKESFLRYYPVEVHYNTIDRSVFKPIPSNFKEKYGLIGKKIILGVASVWDYRKGLDDFLELSKMIDDDFIIVLVGLTKKQIKNMPQNIIGIERTNNIKELAEIYTSSDVFFNPTHEDNYPTTNLEAQACGTPVLTYDTGGSGENILKENIIPEGNIELAITRIKKIVL